MKRGRQYKGRNRITLTAGMSARIAAAPDFRRTPERRASEYAVIRQNHIDYAKNLPMQERFACYMRANLQTVNKYAIKYLLQNWVEMHGDGQRDEALSVCREWVETNRHLFKRKGG